MSSDTGSGVLGDLDQLLTFTEAAKLFRLPGGRVSRSIPTTLSRWRFPGVAIDNKTSVNLRCIRMPSGWMTTREWLNEFFEQLTAAKSGQSESRLLGQSAPLPVVVASTNGPSVSLRRPASNPLPRRNRIEVIMPGYEFNRSSNTLTLGSIAPRANDVPDGGSKNLAPGLSAGDQGQTGTGPLCPCQARSSGLMAPPPMGGNPMLRLQRSPSCLASISPASRRIDSSPGQPDCSATAEPRSTGRPPLPTPAATCWSGTSRTSRATSTGASRGLDGPAGPPVRGDGRGLTSDCRPDFRLQPGVPFGHRPGPGTPRRVCDAARPHRLDERSRDGRGCQERVGWSARACQGRPGPGDFFQWGWPVRL